MLSKAVIIDDEESSVKALCTLLNRHCPQIEIISKCSSAEEGIKALSQLKEGESNVVFLDIEMPFMNGFEILENLKHIYFDLIFVTAYNQYAVKAFKYNAVDYLLKPISSLDLIEAVKRVESKSNHYTSQTQVKEILSYLKNIDKQDSFGKISLPSLDSIQFYNINEIIRCEAQQNYCLFVFKNNPPLLVSKNIGEYEHTLLSYNFMRVHKSHLINLNYVKKFVKGDGGFLIMEDGSTVAVSRNKKDELFSKLVKY